VFLNQYAAEDSSRRSHQIQHIFVNPATPGSSYGDTYNCVDTPDNQQSFNDGCVTTFIHTTSLVRCVVRRLSRWTTDAQQPGVKPPTVNRVTSLDPWPTASPSYGLPNLPIQRDFGSAPKWVVYAAHFGVLDSMLPRRTLPQIV
jgi:hypothetical protein